MESKPLEEITRKVLALRVGKSFQVASDRERRHALTVAREMQTTINHRIVTRASKTGFTVTALPS